MFRFYELYSFYLKKMSSSCGTSPGWCLCEKLPRSILHIAPTPEVWCEVCGRRRRPRACLTSSSDEEERAAELRQQLLAERRRNDQEERRGLVRVKVAMSAKRPMPRRKSHCNKCRVGMVCAQQLRSNHSNNNYNNSNINHGINSSSNNNKWKTYSGRFGCYRKPQRLSLASPSKGHNAPEVEAVAEAHPSAPPPPPSPSPPAGESLWEQTAEDMPNLVAFAHEVFNRPLHMRQCQSSFYDNLFVSDLIPLDKPITDATGGAISKRRRIFGRSHCSQPLPPLSHVLSQIMSKQQLRAKGGGLTPKVDEAHSATQFSPFDSYEGPSEDALVVEGARQMLRQPKALHIGERDDLPNTRLSSFESEPSSDCSSSSPFDVPSAPPTENLRHGYTMGAPLRLHDMMKTVAQSGLSESSLSSSSTDSISSHKSDSSALPPRSRGGEETVLLGKPAEPDMSHISIMEKIIWLMDQKPEANAADHPMIIEPAPDLIEDSHTDSVKGLLQFMESLHIDSKLMQNNLEENLLTTTAQETQETNQTAPAVLPDIDHHSNFPSTDMSNESHLNSTNKSAGDAKYLKGLSGVGGPVTSSSSMWSIISGFFGNGTKRIDPTTATAGNGELQPLQALKGSQRSQYGAINGHRSGLKDADKSKCRGKQRIAPKVLNNLHSNCQKCGRIRSKTCANKPQCHLPKRKPVSSESNSASSIYQTAQITSLSQQYNDQTKNPKAKDCIQDKSKIKKEISCRLFEDVRNVNECRTKKEYSGRSNVPDNSKSCKTNIEIVQNPGEESKKDNKKHRTISPKHVNDNPQKNLKDGNNQIEKSEIQQNKYGKLKKNLNENSRDFLHVPVDIPKQKINIPIVTGNSVQNNNLKTNRTTKSKVQQSRSKTETKTSSTHFESCFGTVRPSSKYSNLKPGKERRDLQLQELLQQLKVVKPSSLKVVHTVKVVGLVKYECSEILTPKMSYSKEIIVGKLNKYSLKQPKSAKSLELLEFRTPDIQKAESNGINAKNTWEVALESLSSGISGEPIKTSTSEIQKTLLKKKQLPVWPARPSRNRKQHTKYKAMQVEPTFLVDKDNDQVEKLHTEHYDTPDTNKTRRKKRNVRWIRNNVLQNQINEMMTKPIKLLS